MRAKQIIVTTMVVFMSACTTEDYYRNANRRPVLSSTADLDAVDTIKTSAASSQRTYIFSITAEDENGNMNSLMVSATGGKAVIMVDEEPSREAIELSKERYKFTRQIEFTPSGDGLHTITVRVVDDFNTSRSVEKRVFSFTNMRPKVECTITRERSLGWNDNIQVLFDYRSSYDRDAKWGGKIDSLFYMSWCQPYYDDNPDAPYDDAHWGCAVPVHDPIGYNKVDFMRRNEPFYDDGVYWTTNVDIWVKDNEGAVSDTIHISGLGHVE